MISNHNYIEDEGRPLELGLQGLGSNRQVRRLLKAFVVSDYGKGRRMTCQVWIRKMNESEPLTKRRKSNRYRQNQSLGLVLGQSSEDSCLLTGRRSVYKRHDPTPGLYMERANLSFRCQGRKPSGGPTRLRVPMRNTGADQLVRAMNSGNAEGAKGLARPAEVMCQLTRGGAHG